MPNDIMKHYLMVDMGTGNTRVAVTDSAGNILAFKSFDNTYYRDNAYPDAQYFLPNEWAAQIFECCDELHKELPDIKINAVSAAGARQSIVLLDKRDCPFYGLPNIDNRGREYMGEIDFKDEIYSLSGKWVTEDFCAEKLYGFKKLYPEEYSKVGTILSLDGWIGYIFTGVKSFEPSQACETQLYDMHTKTWSKALCDRFGIDYSVLPPLCSAGDTVGFIFPELATRFGMAKNAIFVSGGADTQIALHQTGIRVGDIAIVSGTTSPVVSLLDSFCYDPNQRIWVDSNLSADGYVIEMNPGVTGLNYQRFKKNFLPDISYEELEDAYSRKTEFYCTASFSSLLFYEQRSLRRGGFFMPSPLSEKVDCIDMAWAVLADIACSIYEQLCSLIELTGFEKTYVLGCGGGFRSKTFCRMIADLSGLELRIRPGFEQATVNGLVALCNNALGVHDRCTTNEYTLFTPRTKQLIHSYYPLWNENRLKANKIENN